MLAAVITPPTDHDHPRPANEFAQSSHSTRRGVHLVCFGFGAVRRQREPDVGAGCAGLEESRLMGGLVTSVGWMSGDNVPSASRARPVALVASALVPIFERDE